MTGRFERFDARPGGSYRPALTYSDASGTPGYPEVNRLAQVTVPDPVTRLDNGDLDVPGLGRIRAGFTRTDRGMFGFGHSPQESCLSRSPKTNPPKLTMTRRWR